MTALNQTDDAEILARARSGDQFAFNALVTAHERPVYSLAYRLLGNSDDAADATQDAFMNAYRAIGTFRGESIRPWLFRIAVRCCYDQLRRRKRRREDSLEVSTDDNHWDPPDAGADDPEGGALRAETARSVEEALQTLPIDHRTVIVLCDVQGLSYEEAAVAAGVEIGTIKSRLSRARARMRELLRSRGELPGASERLADT